LLSQSTRLQADALLVLRIFVSVLASENFLSKSSLFTPVAPRLKTKALLLMSVDLLMSMVLLMSENDPQIIILFDYFDINVFIGEFEIVS
jgi:hypothetical protein